MRDDLDEPRVPLRARQSDARRSALVAAATQLFEERGFRATTMDAIADRAGLSRRTAFRYFDSKEQLAFPDQGARLELLADALRPLDGETASATVERACLALAGGYEEDRERLVLQRAWVKGEPALASVELEFDRKVVALFESALSHGARSPKARRRAALWSAALVGALRRTIEHWLDEGARGELSRLGRELFAELRAGLPAEGTGR